MELIKTREDGNIVFEKDNVTWMYIHSQSAIDVWLKLNGFESMVKFEQETGKTIKEIFEETVSYNNGAILFAEDQEWWNSFDLERIKAVMNDMQFCWSLSGAFLAYMGELEFCTLVCEMIGKVSGKEVTDALSSALTNEMWYPASDTTDFLESVSSFLAGEFKFELIKKEDDGIQYFI